MTKSQTKSLPKLVLSSSRDIPFSQLVLSQKNVRRVKAGLSIEDLADDIYRRTLLQSLNVRAMLDDDGRETGQFEVPAGGRRFRALELLVKTKRMAKDQPVPCVVREAGIAEEDSLAENVMRVALHPLDQFRAFSALIEAGLSEEDIDLPPSEWPIFYFRNGHEGGMEWQGSTSRKTSSGSCVRRRSC